MKESELDHSGLDHDSHQSPSDQFKAATIPALKVIFTQEQVEQMLKLASEGVKVTFEKSRGRKGNLKKEEEEHDSSQSLRAPPYVAPPSVSSDLMKVKMGKTIVLLSL